MPLKGEIPRVKTDREMTGQTIQGRLPLPSNRTSRKDAGLTVTEAEIVQTVVVLMVTVSQIVIKGQIMIEMNEVDPNPVPVTLVKTSALNPADTHLAGLILVPVSENHGSRPKLQTRTEIGATIVMSMAILLVNAQIPSL